MCVHVLHCTCVHCAEWGRRGGGSVLAHDINIRIVMSARPSPAFPSLHFNRVCVCEMSSRRLPVVLSSTHSHTLGHTPPTLPPKRLLRGVSPSHRPIAANQSGNVHVMYPSMSHTQKKVAYSRSQKKSSFSFCSVPFTNNRRNHAVPSVCNNCHAHCIRNNNGA